MSTGRKHPPALSGVLMLASVWERRDGEGLGVRTRSDLGKCEMITKITRKIISTDEAKGHGCRD